jgi:hypothetical protein
MVTLTDIGNLPECPEDNCEYSVYNWGHVQVTWHLLDSLKSRRLHQQHYSALVSLPHSSHTFCARGFFSHVQSVQWIGYKLGYREIMVQFLTRARDLSLLHYSQTVSGAQPASYRGDTWCVSSGVKTGRAWVKPPLPTRLPSVHRDVTFHR